MVIVVGFGGRLLVNWVIRLFRRLFRLVSKFLIFGWGYCFLIVFFNFVVFCCSFWALMFLVIFFKVWVNCLVKL